MPGRHQAITWTNAAILLIWTLGTNFSEIYSEIHTFSFQKMHLKMSGKWQPFWLCLSMLTKYVCTCIHLIHWRWMTTYIYIYMHHGAESSLVQVMTCGLFNTKQLRDLVLPVRPLETDFSEFFNQNPIILLKKHHLKISSGLCGPFCSNLSVLPAFQGANWQLVIVIYCLVDKPLFESMRIKITIKSLI